MDSQRANLSKPSGGTVTLFPFPNAHYATPVQIFPNRMNCSCSETQVRPANVQMRDRLSGGAGSPERTRLCENPATQGKYREFLQIWAQSSGLGGVNSLLLRDFFSEFPKVLSREFFTRNREFDTRIRDWRNAAWLQRFACRREILASTTSTSFLGHATLVIPTPTSSTVLSRALASFIQRLRCRTVEFNCLPQ